MFEVRAYAGFYHEGGFVDYESAAKHAQSMADITGRDYVVNEIIRRCIIQPRKPSNEPANPPSPLAR